MITLSIGCTWDGRELPAELVAQVTIHPAADGLRIEVDAPFHGDPAPPGPPGPTPKLWEHEVVEVFAADADRRDHYLEVELSPHGHHLVLQLEGVRVPVAQGLPLSYTAQRRGPRWSGTAHVPGHLLPGRRLAINAVAVWGTGSRTYASHVPLPGSAPDFHQPERFAVRWP